MKSLGSALVAIAFIATIGACAPGAEDPGTQADAGVVADAGSIPADGGTTPDAGTSPDAGTTLDAGTNLDAGTTPDAGTGLSTADLAGVFVANNPTNACYATILANAVVEVVAVDADTVSIADGTLTFNCDLANGALSCAQVSGVSAVDVAAGVSCSWPYSVTVGISSLSASSFDAAISFATSPSPTNEQCSNVLGTCSGAASGTFTRFVPSNEQPTAPAKKALVSRSNR